MQAKKVTEKELTKTNLKAALEECKQQPGALQLRKAESAFIAYFRVRYLSSLAEWQKDYDNRGFLSRSIEDPKSRPSEDKQLEIHFNDVKFSQRMNPADEKNQRDIDGLWLSIEIFLSSNSFKSDRRYNALKRSLNYRMDLLGYQFQYLDQCARDAAKKTRTFLEGITVLTSLNKEELLEYLLELNQAMYRAYINGGSALKLEHTTESAYKNQIISDVGCFSPGLFFTEYAKKYDDYIEALQNHLIGFRKEFVANAKLAREEKALEDRKFPTPCDPEKSTPRESLQRYLNAECLVQALGTQELNQLACVRDRCQSFDNFQKRLERFLSSFSWDIESIGRCFSTLASDDKIFDNYLQFLALMQSLAVILPSLRNDAIFSQIMPKDFEKALEDKLGEAFNKLLARVKKPRADILGRIDVVSKKIHPDTLMRSVEFCTEQLSKLDAMCVDSMLDQPDLQAAKEHFDQAVTEKLGALYQARVTELGNLHQELEQALTAKTVDQLNAAVEKINKRIIAERALVEPLELLLKIFKLELPEQYKTGLKNLEDRCLEVRAQLDKMLKKREEIKAINQAISQCANDKVKEQYLALKKFLISVHPQSRELSFYLCPEVNAIFMADVVEKLGFKEAGAKLAERVKKQLDIIEGLLLELSKSRASVGKKPAGASSATGVSFPRDEQIEVTTKAVDIQMKLLEEMGVTEMTADGIPAVIDLISSRWQIVNHTLNLQIDAFVASLKVYLETLKKQLLSETRCGLAALILDVNEKTEEFLQAVMRCAAMKKLCATLKINQSFEAYDELLCQIDLARAAPKKIFDMNIRLNEIIKKAKAKTCLEEEFVLLCGQFEGELKLVDPKHYIILAQTDIIACREVLEAKRQEFKQQYEAGFDRSQRVVMHTLDSMAKGAKFNEAQFVKEINDENEAYARADSRGFEVPAEKRAANLETRKQRLIEILQDRVHKFSAVLDVDSGSLSNRLITKNRKIIEEEKLFSQRVKGICESCGLSDIYERYAQNLAIVESEFSDQEMEKRFFDVLEKLSQYNTKNIAVLDDQALQSYVAIFEELDGILQERLNLQQHASHPRNLGACFSAFEKHLPTTLQADSSSPLTQRQEQVNAFSRTLKERLAGYRARQFDNFDQKITAAIRSRNYQLAQKLMVCLNPLGSARAQKWADITCAIIVILQADDSLNDQARQDLAFTYLNSALLNLAECTIPQRLEFYDQMWNRFRGIQPDAFSIQLQALVLLLRTAEDSKDSEHNFWMSKHKRTAKISETLLKPLEIMIMMKRFLAGETIDGETSSVKWVQSRLEFVNSVVQAELKQPEEKQPRTVPFYETTACYCDEFFPRLRSLALSTPISAAADPRMYRQSPVRQAQVASPYPLVNGARNTVVVVEEAPFSVEEDGQTPDPNRIGASFMNNLYGKK